MNALTFFKNYIKATNRTHLHKYADVSVYK